MTDLRDATCRILLIYSTPRVPGFRIRFAATSIGQHAAYLPVVIGTDAQRRAKVGHDCSSLELA